MTRVLDGKIVARRLKERARLASESLRKEGVQPKLAILRVGESEASISYERNAKKAMKQSDIEVESFILDKESTTQEVIETIKQLNTDDAIHGVIIMQPLPEHISRHDISSQLNPDKDVDGIHPLNLGYLIEGNEKALVPSTPQAVIEMLDYYNILIKGANIVVIGSSAVVGKPLAIMLTNLGATVTNPHIYTENLRHHTNQADILISATGALEMIDASYIKLGTLVIDVGYGYKNGKITGDVNFADVYPTASLVSPVPGGVGSVTTAVLAAQVIKAAQNQTANRRG